MEWGKEQGKGQGEGSLEGGNKDDGESGGRGGMYTTTSRTMADGTSQSSAHKVVF